MTRQARGMKGSLLMAFENEYGVTPSLPKTYRLPFNTNNLTGKRSLIESNTITGRRDPVEPGMGTSDVSGSLTLPLDVQNTGVLLTLMFGEPETTGTVAPYTHIWTVKDDMPSATFEKGYSDIPTYAVYPGCKISKFSMSASAGNDELTYSVDIMGAEEIINDKSLDTNPTLLEVFRFNNFQASVIEGGKALAICRKMDIEIDFGLDGDTWCLNGRAARSDIVEGIIQPTGNIELLFKDSELLNKAINGTETSLQLTFSRAKHSLEFLFPELIFDQSTPPIDGPKGLLLPLAFRSYYGNNDRNSAVVITLINDVPSYAI